MSPEPAPPAPAPSPIRRFGPLIAIAALLALAFALGLHEHISLEALRQNREALQAFVEAHLLAALGAYMLVYALAVTISLPGAVFLTLSGGFLFGTWLGGAATWLGATAGALMVFLAARSAFGDVLRKHAGGWLKQFETGFRDNAFNYILALRLLPIMPFWAVNLAPAFFDVKLRDYALATMIGIAPATFVYASVGAALRAAFAAGTALDPAAAARELLFSPAVIGPIAGLIALALVPVVMRAVRKPKPGANP